MSTISINDALVRVESSDEEDESEILQSDELGKRTKIVIELLQTERSFLLPVKNVTDSSDEIIKPRIIEAIFGNLEEVYSLNCQFVNELEERIEGNWDEDLQTIGDLFIAKIGQFNELYNIYVKNHELSIQVLKDLEKKNPKWTSFLQKVKEKGEVGKWDIYSFLIQPVQRIPRYELLLRDLIKETPDYHADYLLLNESLAGVCSISANVNLEMKKQEEYKRILKVEKNFTNLTVSIAIPGRKLIKEGALMKVCRKVNKKRYFYLFNDAIVYSTIISPTQYKFNRLLNMLGKKTRVQNMEDSPEIKNALQIISSEKSFIVFAETNEEKNSWLKAIQSILPSSEKKKQEPEHSELAPIWIQDSLTKVCMICETTFTVIKRRHHCRNCGKVICGTCSGYKRLLPHIDKTREVRICKICFDNPNIKMDPRSRSTTALVKAKPVPASETKSLRGRNKTQSKSASEFLENQLNQIDKQLENEKKKTRKPLSSFLGKPTTELPEDPKPIKQMSNAPQPPVKLPQVTGDQSKLLKSNTWRAGNKTQTPIQHSASTSKIQNLFHRTESSPIEKSEMVDLPNEAFAVTKKSDLNKSEPISLPRSDVYSPPPSQSFLFPNKPNRRPPAPKPDSLASPKNSDESKSFLLKESNPKITPQESKSPPPRNPLISSMREQPKTSLMNSQKPKSPPVSPREGAKSPPVSTQKDIVVALKSDSDSSELKKPKIPPKPRTRSQIGMNPVNESNVS